MQAFFIGGGGGTSVRGQDSKVPIYILISWGGQMPPPERNPEMCREIPYSSKFSRSKTSVISACTASYRQHFS